MTFPTKIKRTKYCNVHRPEPILVAKVWRRNLDYAKNLQAKYFTDKISRSTVSFYTEYRHMWVWSNQSNMMMERRKNRAKSTNRPRRKWTRCYSILLVHNNYESAQGYWIISIPAFSYSLSLQTWQKGFNLMILNNSPILVLRSYYRVDLWFTVISYCSSEIWHKN